MLRPFLIATGLAASGCSVALAGVQRSSAALVSTAPTGRPVFATGFAEVPGMAAGVPPQETASIATAVSVSPRHVCIDARPRIGRCQHTFGRRNCEHRDGLTRQ